MTALHVKKNDIVVVLWGEHKGQSGKILAAFPQKQRVLIEGVNLVKKAARKSEDRPKGGIITKEAPLSVSKVMLQSRYQARQQKRNAAADTGKKS